MKAADVGEVEPALVPAPGKGVHGQRLVVHEVITLHELLGIQRTRPGQAAVIRTLHSESPFARIPVGATDADVDGAIGSKGDRGVTRPEPRSPLCRHQPRQRPCGPCPSSVVRRGEAEGRGGSVGVPSLGEGRDHDGGVERVDSHIGLDLGVVLGESDPVDGVSADLLDSPRVDGRWKSRPASCQDGTRPGPNQAQRDDRDCGAGAPCVRHARYYAGGSRTVPHTSSRSAHPPKRVVDRVIQPLADRGLLEFRHAK